MAALFGASLTEPLDRMAAITGDLALLAAIPPSLSENTSALSTPIDLDQIFFADASEGSDWPTGPNHSSAGAKEWFALDFVTPGTDPSLGLFAGVGLVSPPIPLSNPSVPLPSISNAASDSLPIIAPTAALTSESQTPEGASEALMTFSASENYIAFSGKAEVSVSAVNDAQATEGIVDTASFEISRSGDPSETLWVPFVFSGTATPATGDYTPMANGQMMTGGVQFQAGQSAVTITLNATSDNVVEGTETAVLQIFDQSMDYNVGSPDSALITILDNDSGSSNGNGGVFGGSGNTVNVGASDANAGEPGNDGVFTFTRSGDLTNPLTANYVTTGSATPAMDYVSLSGSTTFGAGQGTVTASVAVTDDSWVETDETVVVTLTPNMLYSTGMSSSATVTVADDDTSSGGESIVSVNAIDSSAAEMIPVDSGTFEFNRTGNLMGELTVALEVTGSADEEDYQSMPQTITFLSGQSTTTILVDPIDDLWWEGTEDVELRIVDGANYAVGVEVAIVSITDNETSNQLATDDKVMAGPDSFTIAKDAVLSIAAPGVLANDFDMDSRSLTAEIAMLPMFGSLLLQSNGAFNYVPASGFVGTDHFNYRAVASPSASDLTTVEIQVRDTNEAPVALSDFYQMSKNQTLSVQKDDGVLSNDFDFDGDSLRLLSFGSPANGAVESVARGGFVYSPDVGFVGVDSFSYEITDGIDVATGSVSIQVVNDAPNGLNDSYIISANTPLIVDNEPLRLNVLSNDWDPNADVLKAIRIPEMETEPAHGTLSNFASDGTFVYTPAPGFDGVDQFTYHVTDGALSSIATVVIIVAPEIKLQFADNGNRGFNVATDALGVSNWVTTFGLEKLAETKLISTSKDPENFRVWVQDPAGGQSVNATIQVYSQTGPDWQLRSGSGYMLTLKSADGWYTGPFLRLVSDKFDDAASGHGASSDPDKQTILVGLGDKVTLSYIDAAKTDYSTSILVGRPVSEDNNGAVTYWKHDIREVKVNVISYRLPGTKKAMVSYGVFTELLIAADAALAQVGVRLKVVSTAFGSKDGGVALPTGGGIDWSNGTATLDPLYPGFAHKELLSLLSKNSDKNTVDILFVPELAGGDGEAIKGLTINAPIIKQFFGKESAANQQKLMNTILLAPTLVTVRPPDLILPHELLHVLLNATHEKDNRPKDKEDEYSLFNHEVSDPVSVTATKRIGPYEPFAPASLGKGDQGTIRKNSESLPG